MDKLKDLACELNHDVFAMVDTVESLHDVEILLGQLMDDMNGVIHRGEECVGYYHEHRRRISVLWRVIHYTVKNLEEEYEKIEKVQKSIFDMVVKENSRIAESESESIAKSVDITQIFGVPEVIAEVLEIALKCDGEQSLTYKCGTEEVTKPATQEEFVDHYVNYAIEKINNVVSEYLGA